MHTDAAELLNERGAGPETRIDDVTATHVQIPEIDGFAVVTRWWGVRPAVEVLDIEPGFDVQGGRSARS